MIDSRRNQEKDEGREERKKRENEIIERNRKRGEWLIKNDSRERWRKGKRKVKREWNNRKK